MPINVELSPGMSRTLILDLAGADVGLENTVEVRLVLLAQVQLAAQLCKLMGLDIQHFVGSSVDTLWLIDQ
ncbi:hypothetical protein QEP27_22795 [Pseudomonas nunensis]|nr:hypothetical protein [Pseudomonas nunensis]